MRGGLVAMGREIQGLGGRMAPSVRAAPLDWAAVEGRRACGGWSLARLPVGCGVRMTRRNCRAAWLGLSGVGGPGSCGGLQHLGGHLVVGLGVVEPGLAGQTGLVRAVGAGGGAVVLVVGGYVERGDDSADFGAGEDDRVVCVRVGWSWFDGRARRGVGEVGGVAGAVVDVSEVEDRSDGLASVPVVVRMIAVAFQHVEHAEDQSGGEAVVVGHGRISW